MERCKIQLKRRLKEGSNNNKKYTHKHIKIIDKSVRLYVLQRLCLLRHKLVQICYIISSFALFNYLKITLLWGVFPDIRYKIFLTKKPIVS